MMTHNQSKKHNYEQEEEREKKREKKKGTHYEEGDTVNKHPNQHLARKQIKLTNYQTNIGLEPNII